MLRQILSGLGVEGEACSNAVVAAGKITNQPFQIVIIDWDNQPEAGLLLSTARERKASERPITLAIVSADLSVPAALQAGANSILRKPIIANQAKDTLTTARDLLRSMQHAAPAPQAAAAAAGASSLPSSAADKERTLRAGEFLQTPTLAPGGHFETESEVHAATEESPVEVDPLKDLEPTAASVAQSEPTPPISASTPAAPEGRGLDWYLKNRVATQQSGPTSKSRGNPELMGYDETLYSPPPKSEPEPVRALSLLKPETTDLQAKPDLPKLPELTPNLPSPEQERREAQLFSYLESGIQLPDDSKSGGSRLWRRAIVPALLLAAAGIAFAPQAPWHTKIRSLWLEGQQALHAWLNPQPVTPPQAAPTHETFNRAGDEYKLPVAEAIPDATTDPSQIKVLPAVDPTAKKPADASNADPSAATPDPSPAGTGMGSPTTAQPSDNQPPATSTPQTSTTSTPAPAVSAAPSTTQAPTLVSSHSDAPPLVASTSISSAPTKVTHYVTPTGIVPPSLKSQLAPTTPPGGNKAPEAALPSIEPVDVPEATERALLFDEPVPAYPANAKGQQGSVILQVLIGRDGTVQDAKFIQGSLAFARPAIDGVKQWKFKPYIMNGRPVSVQTQLTLKFKPAQ